MYFVTTKRPGYTLFSMSPSEQFAVGLTEDQRVHLFGRDADGAWQVLREWNASDYSHTDFMASLHRREEPANAAQWLALLPPAVTNAAD